MRTSFSNLGLRHAATALNAIAPRDADGKPQTRAAVSDADRALGVGDDDHVVAQRPLRPVQRGDLLTVRCTAHDDLRAAAEGVRR